MYAAAMRKTLFPIVLCSFFLRTPVASAQGASRLYPVGAEAKVHAGAGQLTSRGAPANYYNPANLAATPATAIYGELDVIVADYSFEYPGEDAVEVKIRTPAPYFGLSFAPTAALTVGVSALVLPAGKGQTLKSLPTREFAENADSEPVLLDVKTGGKGVSYQGALGVAYRFLETYSAGLSLLVSGGTSTLKATEADGDGVLVKSQNKSYSYQVLLGGRGTWLDDRIQAALTVRAPSRTKSKGRTDYPALDGGTDTASSGKGPLAYGGAVSGLVTDSLAPFVEVLHTNWHALRTQGGEVLFDRVDIDYYDTNDVMVGADYVIGKNQATLAAGFFQSELGDGVMAAEAGDGRELIGYGIQNAEAIGFSTYAAGYKFTRDSGYLQTGLTYTTGDREVGRKARGYGTYKLKYYAVVAGGIWRL